MLNEVNIENILFLDIETVPAVPAYSELSEVMQQLWDKKALFIKKDENQSSAEVFDRAGIYAEFGKVICISVGFVFSRKKVQYVRLKSFYNSNEQQLLEEFGELLRKFGQRKGALMCAHNGKEFDFPYIARRMLINGVSLPGMLNVAGKKPWEVSFLDTMELWKFGDHKNYTSLHLLATIFGIPTPKDDIDGSMVAEVYYRQHDIDRIVTYCEKDVLTIVQLLRKYRGEELIPAENIERASESGSSVE
ncbi:MAG TPA: 3'-5' exonuclease [Williamwhitmania sp.]|nr:3'-5' exonuclease [Williamwhitmania sp.]